MWHFHDSYVPEPPPPSSAELSRALCTAIDKGEADRARGILDDAFWRKLDFKPDGFHLLMAAQRGDRALVTLLAGYGAGWTEDEAKVARTLIAPDKWAQIRGPLKAAGIRTEFSPEELAKRDLFTAVAFAHRSLADATARGLPGIDDTARELDRALTKGFAALVLTGQMEDARRLLPYRSAKLGRGTPDDPLDVAEELEILFRANPLSAATGLKFLDRLQAAGLEVKPLQVTASMMFLKPEVVLELEQRRLLAPEQAVARAELLDSWTVLQQRIRLGNRILDFGAESIARRHRQLTDIARALFPKDRPATEREAEQLIRLHRSRSGQVPEAVRAAETALVDLGFFDGPAWDASRLQRLISAAPITDETLSRAFNGRALRRTIEETTIERLLRKDQLWQVVEAHRLKAYAANAADTAKIIRALSKEVPRRGPVPESVIDALQTLKAGGADFSGIDPMAYLGKREPGLAKALLDLGLVEAAHFDVRGVSRRQGGKLQLVTLPDARNHGYTGFVCQLVLELTAPEKFIPLRGASATEYQRLFLQEWLKNSGNKRISSFSYHRKHPGP